MNRSRVRRACAAAKAAVVGGLLGGAVLTGPSLPARAMVLWNYDQFQMPGPEVFPRYVEMISRYVSQYQSLTSACTTAPTAFCDYIGDWAQLMRDAGARQGRAQVELVNDYFNRFRYILDMTNWSVVDYWATPLQFYDVNGDCEDYAIAKYYTLRGLGYDASAMRIVVLLDRNLGIHHAVLAVEVDGDILILDNQISGVVSASRISHYEPILSLNEVGAWRHH